MSGISTIEKVDRWEFSAARSTAIIKRRCGAISYAGARMNDWSSVEYSPSRALFIVNGASIRGRNLISRDDARSSRKSDGSGARRAGYLFDDSIQLIAWPTVPRILDSRGVVCGRGIAANFPPRDSCGGNPPVEKRGTNRCIGENPIKLPRVCSSLFFSFLFFPPFFTNSKFVRGRSGSDSKLFRFILINSRQRFISSCLSGGKMRLNFINFASKRKSFSFLWPILSVESLSLRVYHRQKIDHRCKRLFSFLFFSFCSFATKSESAGASPIFESSSIEFFTRDKRTRRCRVDENSGELSSAKSRFVNIPFPYIYIYLYALPIILSLSLLLISPPLFVNARIAKIYICSCFRIYIYIYIFSKQIDFVFLFPRGGEQQTRAYLLLPRLKSIFAITRPVHGNSDSRRRYSPSL